MNAQGNKILFYEVGVTTYGDVTRQLACLYGCNIHSTVLESRFSSYQKGGIAALAIPAILFVALATAGLLLTMYHSPFVKPVTWAFVGNFAFGLGGGLVAHFTIQRLRQIAENEEVIEEGQFKKLVDELRTYDPNLFGHIDITYPPSSEPLVNREVELPK